MASDARLPFDLETEMREGVPHFKRGQHRALVGDGEPDSAILIYVGNMGWAVVMPCERESGAWKHCGVALSVSCNGPRTTWQEVRGDFALNEAMIAALNEAEVVADEDGLIPASGDGQTVVDRS